MSNIDFFQIGALKVFAELGQLIDNDDHNKTKFTDIPYDIIKIIKNHVTNFKDNEEEYKFLRNFREGQNKDLYKYFFDKELYYFVPEVVTRRSSIEPDTYRYQYKFYLDSVNLDELLGYVNEKYERNTKRAYIIFEYRNGINDKGKKYVEIGDIEINKNNKLRFNYGSPKGFSKEYNLPEKYNQYLNNNVWNIKNIL